MDDRIHSELEYLDSRVEFWRQQKPMYARRREKELKKIKPEPTQPIGMSLRAPSGPPNHARYVLKSLEEIDASKTLSCAMMSSALSGCVFGLAISCTTLCMYIHPVNHSLQPEQFLSPTSTHLATHAYSKFAHSCSTCVHSPHQPCQVERQSAA